MKLRNKCQKRLKLTKGWCQKMPGQGANGTPPPIGLAKSANYCQEHGCSICLFKNKGKIMIEGKRVCEVCGKREIINNWKNNEKSLDKELEKISPDFYTAIYPVKVSIFSFKEAILKKEIGVEELKTVLFVIDGCPSLDTKEKNDWKALYQGIGKKERDKLIDRVFPAEKHFLLNLAWKRKQKNPPTPNPIPTPPNSPSPNNPPPPNTPDTPTPAPNQPNNDHPDNKDPVPKQPKPDNNQNEKKCEICGTLSNDLVLFMKTSELIVYFPEISQIYLQAVPEKFHAKVKEINELFEVNEKERMEIELIIKKEKETVKKVAQEKGINNLFIGQMVCSSCYQEIEKNQKVIFAPENEKKLGEKTARGVKVYQELRRELEKEIGKEKMEELDKKIEEFLKQREGKEKVYKPINQKEKKIPTWGIIILIIIGIVVVIMGLYYLTSKKKKRKLTQFTLAN